MKIAYCQWVRDKLTTMLKRCCRVDFLIFFLTVSVGAFVKGLSQISSFFKEIRHKNVADLACQQRVIHYSVRLVLSYVLELRIVYLQFVMFSDLRITPGTSSLLKKWKKSAMHKT